MYLNEILYDFFGYICSLTYVYNNATNICTCVVEWLYSLGKLNSHHTVLSNFVWSNCGKCVAFTYQAVCVTLKKQQQKTHTNMENNSIKKYI